MNEQIVRNCVVADRLARGLADYYSRRVRGVSCSDFLPADERERMENRHDQRLQSARAFMQGAPVHMLSAG